LQYSPTFNAGARDGANYEGGAAVRRGKNPNSIRLFLEEADGSDI
jgi:hypothetical protein